MPSGAMNELIEQFPTLIRDMPASFTSHEFILRLAQRHQRAYVEALSEYVNGGEPFREVHRQLSARLHRYPELVVNEGVASSRDIFGHSNTCAKWRRF
jgi:hypothetical protein